MIVRNGKLATIWIAGMIHEPNGATHKLAIDDVTILKRDTQRVLKLIENVKITVFALSILLTFVGFS